ncbi:hypothetical protein QR680_011090 [Steinernema hermaphroditum]|uniref:Peptidase S1 domain-containing protein n=1 Tax=Steinernema hermaphroditum TaxID=289476 RepID=A0AA39IR44_9BILA|nr:hypothetical protein QR680_011090 [Steinernema hermaphroditum]
MQVLIEALLLFGLMATVFTKNSIVGPGSRASTPGDHPYFASLVTVSTNQKFCGASIIGSRWILTAAHCLMPDGKLFQKGQFEVMVGHHSKRQDWYAVKRIKLRTKYNDLNAGNDVAILETDRNITFKENVQPICVAGFDIEAGEPALTMGFGYTRIDSHSKRMLEIDGTILDAEKCGITHGFNNREGLCFLANGGSPCSGDSGGPIVDKYGIFQHGLHHGVYPGCKIGPPSFGHRVSSMDTCLFIALTTRGEVECRKEYEC